VENVFKNSNTLSHAIKEIVDIDLTARPWNRFDPDNTIWWLVPSKDWPAYKYGKLFFDSRKNNFTLKKNEVYCGFYIEKGLGVKDFYHNSLIIDKEWLWGEFIKSLPQVVLPDKSILTIKASYMPDRIISSDPQELQEQKERLAVGLISFTVKEGSSLSLLKEEIKSTDPEISNYFHKIAESKNIKDLIDLLLEIPNNDWIWVDLYTGHFFSENDKISIKEIWEKYLSLWKPWLRKATKNG